MHRSYDLKLQVAIARRIRMQSSPEWDRFRNLWQAYNALYNLVGRQIQEREQARRVIRLFLSEEDAQEVFTAAEEAIGRMADLPPGDMRFSSEHPRFRRTSAQYAAVVLDPSNAAVDRLAHVMGMVYQVRCNLIHGNKDPDVPRDHDLVTWSNVVLELALPALEDAIQAREE